MMPLMKYASMQISTNETHIYSDPPTLLSAERLSASAGSATLNMIPGMEPQQKNTIPEAIAATNQAGLCTTENHNVKESLRLLVWKYSPKGGGATTYKWHSPVV
jgi:hypothetical protein